MYIEELMAEMQVMRMKALMRWTPGWMVSHERLLESREKTDLLPSLHSG